MPVHVTGMVTIAKLIAIVVLALGAYGLLSFVELSLDPTNWTGFARALFAFLLFYIIRGITIHHAE